MIVEKGIPFPKVRERVREGDELKAMVKGDSFIWTLQRSKIYKIADKVGVKITSRKLPDGTIRVWVL